MSAVPLSRRHIWQLVRRRDVVFGRVCLFICLQIYGKTAKQAIVIKLSKYSANSCCEIKFWTKLNENPETSVLSRSVQWQRHLANVAKPRRGCCALHCLLICVTRIGCRFCCIIGPAVIVRCNHWLAFPLNMIFHILA